MDVLKLIKKRRTIRKYKDKPILRQIIDKIIEAGRWAPSAHNLQPWRFLVIKNRQEIEKLALILKNAPNSILTAIKFLIKKNAEIIEKSPVVILVYNTGVLSKKAKKLGELYFINAHIAEIESISAAIENMHLIATSLGIGMAWFAMPLLMKNEISKIFHLEGELVAILTLGYPVREKRLSTRKPIAEIVKYIT